MTNKELNNRIEKINNEIEYYLNTKELLEEKSRKKLYKEQELLKKDIENINAIIDILYKKRSICLLALENQLKELGTYEELKQKIIYYKEESLKKYTWSEIANMVHYSETQCRRIYRKYKNQRSID